MAWYVDQGMTIQLFAATDANLIDAQIFAWGYLVDCTGGCTKG